jgi:hypothetical protein
MGIVCFDLFQYIYNIVQNFWINTLRLVAVVALVNIVVGVQFIVVIVIVAVVVGVEALVL